MAPGELGSFVKRSALSQKFESEPVWKLMLELNPRNKPFGRGKALSDPSLPPCEISKQFIGLKGIWGWAV